MRTVKKRLIQNVVPTETLPTALTLEFGGDVAVHLEQVPGRLPVMVATRWGQHTVSSSTWLRARGTEQKARRG